MANNLTIESPNFEKIGKEAGNFTADAISLLWNALNDTRKTERIDFRQASETLAPKFKQVTAAASVDNLDLEGASIVEFIGGSAQDCTGFRAPETGRSRVLFVNVSGSGTITFKHQVTSDSGNQLVISSGADLARASGSGIIFAYLSSKWREVART